MFDIFCFEGCGIPVPGGFGTGWGGFWGGGGPLLIGPSASPMSGIFTDPDVSTAGSGAQFVLLPGPVDCDLTIESGRSTDPSFPTDDARLLVSKGVPQAWTLEWTVKFEHLPPNFSDLVNQHIYFGASDANGPIVGIFVSKIGVLYTGSIHHDPDLILDTATQIIPGSSAYINEGEYITFRIAADAVSGITYFYATKTIDLLTSGHQLRAILPTILFTASAYPAFLTDRAIISVRGTTPQPSFISLEEFCLAAELVIPNIAPVANAGSDQAVRFCSIIQLDGTASFDPEGAPVLYFWRLIEAPLGSSFAVEENDGFTLAGIGFTDHFYSPDLGIVDGIDPIQSGDVLQLNGEPFDIFSTGTDFNGFFVKLTLPVIPLGLSGTPFKVLRQRGISGLTTVNPTFYPDKPGFYKFDLVVNDGALLSTPSAVIVNVLESPLPRGCTPDLKFLFSYLSDFWNLVEDRDKITVFWSAIAQVTATELYTLWQLEYSKSLRDIQRTFARRWLHYDLLLPEPVPELTRIRAVWGGITSTAFLSDTPFGPTSLGILEVTSPLLAEPIQISLDLPAGSTVESLAHFVETALQQADSRFSARAIRAFNPTLPGFVKYLRIDGSIPFSIGSGTTTILFFSGQKNQHPSNTVDAYFYDPPIGFAVGADTFKVNRSLQGLDIRENDFLCVDGVALRIVRIITDPADLEPDQRVVVKDPIPVSLTGKWDITGFVTSELLDFFNGLVAAEDPIFFEVVDDTGLTASTQSMATIIQSTALGVCEALPSFLPFDEQPIGEFISEPDRLAVRLAKVVRRKYLPIDPLVADIPTFQDKIVIEDDERVLRRNIDYFIQLVRGRQAVRFAASLDLAIPDIWERQVPPDRLWAEYTHLDNKPLIEENFGIPAEFTLDDLSRLPSSTDYLSVVQGLWYAYFNGPTLQNLRIGTQILLGLPFAEAAGIIEELRIDFSPNLGRILIRDTDNSEIVRSYSFPRSLAMEINPATNAPYAIGDEVARFAPLVTGAEIIDYVKDPRWFEGILHQGVFFEIEKFFKFLVRIDSAAFSLSTLLFVRNFILKVKPTYTFPLFIVRKEIGDTEVSVTDQVISRGRLILNETVCEGWVGSTMFDDYRAGGGGSLNKFDSNADPDDAPPIPFTPDADIRWGYDKNFLCPDDSLQKLCCFTTAGGPVPFDTCAAFDTPLKSTQSFSLVGPFVIPAGPAGFTVSSSLASLTGTISNLDLLIIGGPGTDPPAYELVIAINTVDVFVAPFTSSPTGVIELLFPAVVITVGDTIDVRIRPAAGGPFSPAWTNIFVQFLEDPLVVWVYDAALPAGTYCTETSL